MNMHNPVHSDEEGTGVHFNVSTITRNTVAIESIIIMSMKTNKRANGLPL